LKAKWIKRMMEVAKLAASWSKDKTQVGAVAWDEHRRILGTGYNGLPRGVEDRPERMTKPAKYDWTAHAEENLVANAARTVLGGSTVGVTHLCCNACARMLINAGVAKVVVGSGKTSMPPHLFEIALQMFAEAGVEVTYEDDYYTNEDYPF
jgi:dCMP deaminase